MSMIVWIVLGLIFCKIVGGTGVTGFNIDSVYSAGIGAIMLLALYHVFFRRRML